MSDYIILEFIEPGPPFITIEGDDYYIDKRGRGIAYALSPDHLTATCTTIVTEIAKGAYHNLNVLKCIRIPHFIKSIGLYAFSNCSSLNSVIFDCGDDVSIRDILGQEQFETSSHIGSEHLSCLIDCNYSSSSDSESDSECECDDSNYSSISDTCSSSSSSSSNSSCSSRELMDFTVFETSLRVFRIDNINVLEKSLIKIQYGTTAVRIVAVPYQCKSVVRVKGGKRLKPGPNLVRVTVTSPLGDTRVYSVVVYVKLLPDELACLLEGTTVRTPEGYVPIETIREGDYIRTLKYDIVVTKVGKWEVDLNDEKQRNDLSRKMYKIPAGRLNCDSDTYISHYHRILIEDASNAENSKLFRLPEKIGLEVANPLQFAVDGKFRFYHLQLKYGNYFMVSGGCIVEAWESGAKYF